MTGTSNEAADPKAAAALRDYSDALPPLLVKELRQGPRGRLFVIPFCILHAVLALGSLDRSLPAAQLFWLGLGAMHPAASVAKSERPGVRARCQYARHSAADGPDAVADCVGEVGLGGCTDPPDRALGSAVCRDALGAWRPAAPD